MTTTPYAVKRLGRESHGQHPCINPLAMAELMLRLEDRRHNTKQPSRVAAWLRRTFKRSNSLQ